jgi:Amt family ammonium transporter
MNTAPWRKFLAIGSFALPLALAAAPAQATVQKLDSGDTGWMLLCGILVLMMTIPGLVLFYGGMVRRKDVLAIMMQSFIICAMVSVLWMVLGYSLAFTGSSPWIGGLSALFLGNLANGWNQAFVLGAGLPGAVSMAVPQSVFVFFQMTFAIITPAVITGAFADRMKFSSLLLLMGCWTLLVYAPVAHWVWSPAGWLHQLGLADYAGGTVVEINAGIAGLVCALYLGRRLGYGTETMKPWNLSYAVIGGSLLWVGWLGFNSGAAGGANANAGMAVLATQMAAAGAALSWTAVAWLRTGKPTVLGAISGAVTGLVAITPAAGFVLPGAALAIGLLTGVICYFAVTVAKIRLGYDDSLDAFGVHGVGGMVGILATGVFAYGPLSNGTVQPGLHQLGIQAVGMCATILYCGLVTLLLLKFVDMTFGLRVAQDQEQEGLDKALHGETL